MVASTSNARIWSLAPIRQAKGISLEEIAGRTKLRVAVVKAIEDGNFGELPGGIYNISYLRQYAREIGADDDLLVQWYEHGCAPPENLIKAQRAAPTQEEIAERANLLWQQRGCPEGNSEEDWLKAEQQLMSAPD